MGDLLTHNLTHVLQNSGVPAGDAEQVARIVSQQMMAPSGPSAEASSLVAMASSDQVAQRVPGRLKWGDITLKRGYISTQNAWPSKWKMASFDGKGNDVSVEAGIRELAYEILSQR